MGTTGLTPTPTSLFPLTGLSCPLLCGNLSGNKGKNTISDNVGLPMGLYFHHQLITDMQGPEQSARPSLGMQTAPALLFIS